MKGKWRDRCKLYENVKLGDDFYWSHLKSYPHLRCHDFSWRYMKFLAFALDNSSCSACLEDYYESDQSKYILIKLMKFETRARSTCQLNFWQKKNDTLHIIQCLYQALRYSIVYINVNCQAANIFSSWGVWTLVGTWSKNYIFPWQTAGDFFTV